MTYDIVCFSHLRWDFVYQRPQHLLSRFSRHHRVYFVEEAEYSDGTPRLDVRKRGKVNVLVPVLPQSMRGTQQPAIVSWLLQEHLLAESVSTYILWFYTPMALPFARTLRPLATVYDCMDELSAFANAPAGMVEWERELLRHANLVFAGGPSLFEAKRRLHEHVVEFPSCVDLEHFRKARSITTEPPDQSSIPHPRLGFYGVIDERLDIDLVATVARERSDWHIILVGPIFDFKIDPLTLPRSRNIHYLGQKSYGTLPAYLAGWDVAILPFALDESTRFISPTKTPEYLAAGRPVVSTPIRDVEHVYGRRSLVATAGTPEEFIRAVERALAEPSSARLSEVDAFLSHSSWDRTSSAMEMLIGEAIEANRAGQSAAAETPPAVELPEEAA
ncbi:MAG TPA: glycosyltransferase [Chloroflexota bacterium]|nr:glycosyltransferase [Chloroflexota bacterium]